VSVSVQEGPRTRAMRGLIFQLQTGPDFDFLSRLLPFSPGAFGAHVYCCCWYCCCIEYASGDCCCCYWHRL